MTAEEWDRTDDWARMLAAVPDAAGSRKLRLWCVAWAREVLAVADRYPPFAGYATNWFAPASLAGYARQLDAAEAFADGRLSRRELNAARAPTGGPWNVFHLPVGLSRLTPGALTTNLAYFANEFRIPTAPQLAGLLREVFGNPFRAVEFDPAWRTDTAVALARGMYEARDFGAMPILADALQDAGCDSEPVLAHCRDAAAVHVRGCWVVDLVLGQS